MLKILLLAALLIVFGNQVVIAAPVKCPPAYQLLQQTPSVFLLEVRSSETLQNYRLAGVNLIPIDNLLARERELSGDRPILVDCEVGHCSA